MRPPELCPAALVWVALLAGCTFPTDAERFPPLPERPFVLVATEPAQGAHDVPTNPLVRLRLSDFPDPEALGEVVLRSGRQERRCGGLSLQEAGCAAPRDAVPCEVDLVAKEILVRPEGLAPDQEHQVELGALLRSLAGVRLPAAQVLRFRTGSMTRMEPPSEPVGLAEVLGPRGGLGSSCTLPGTCHAPAGQAPAARGLDLTLPEEALRSMLTTSRARGSPEQLLQVEPCRPDRSYLLRKLLAYDGFVRTEGDPMPMPPFVRLEEAAIRLISDWVRQGAPLRGQR
ncbi:MAG: hypothetical protein RMK29_08815 [Myxococcales bacterium]|nr:hypothetical protein [Myxococcota bacterium]MDW8281798.1 hypothetical protein [Myxococcales bacterium]